MPAEGGPKSSNNRFFVLALGLLVGFVIGFILLLANLPVDQSTVDFRARPVSDQAGERPTTQFEFYSVLADSGLAGSGAGSRADSGTDSGTDTGAGAGEDSEADPGPGDGSAASTAMADAAAVATGTGTPRQVIEASARTVPASPPPSARAPATVAVAPPAGDGVVSGDPRATGQTTIARTDPAGGSLTMTGNQTYFLQAGSFREARAAERMRASVLLLGLEAFIVTRQEADGTLGHRVRIGPFHDQERLTEAKLRLRRGNVAYEIVRVTG